MTVSKIVSVIGSPGCGKTYTMVRRANEYLENNESIFICTPTHASLNNVKTAFKELYESGGMSKENYEKTFTSSFVIYGYKDSLSQHILLDESAMFGVEYFYGIIQKANNLSYDVTVDLFGDLKQLEPVHGNSILREIIDFNRKKNDNRSIWEFAKDTMYDQLDNMEINVPIDWDLDIKKISLQVLKTNYRLESKNFSGYDDEYYNYLIGQAIQSDDYSGYLEYGIENYWLIVAPTKLRGKEVDETLDKIYKGTGRDMAPFVINNTDGKYYLNPYHDNYDELKSHFDFMPEIDKEELSEEFVTTGYLNVHRVQSFSCDNVIFYLGNMPIGKRFQTFYSNNMLYTSVTRARHNVKLLGLPESFEQMRETMPLSAQEKNVHLRAKIAKNKLFKWIEDRDSNLTADEIYNKYMKLYGDDTILSNEAHAIIKFNRISSKPFTKRYIIKSVDDNFKGKFGFNLADWLNKNSKNSKKKPRQGKIKVWISELKEEEMSQLKKDLQSRLVKQDDFLNKYGFTKKAVRQAL